MSDDDFEDLLQFMHADSQMEMEAIEMLLEVLKDYRKDGLESSVLWSLFFQFLKLEASEVRQAIIYASREWDK